MLPKNGAKVLLTAGEKPILVTGEYGKGRVAVFAGTVMGDLPAHRTAFWDWDGWPALVSITLQWLSEAPRKAGPASVSESPGFLLRTAANRPADLALPVLEELRSSLWPLVRSGEEKATRELIQSGQPLKTALGVSLPGALHTDDAIAVLSRFYETGRPQPVSKGDDVGIGESLAETGATRMEPVLDRDLNAQMTALRLGVLAGLGHLGNAQALAVLRKAVDARARTGGSAADGVRRILDGREPAVPAGPGVGAAVWRRGIRGTGGGCVVGEHLCHRTGSRRREQIQGSPEEGPLHGRRRDGLATRTLSATGHGTRRRQARAGAADGGGERPAGDGAGFGRVRGSAHVGRSGVDPQDERRCGRGGAGDRAK